MSVNYDQTPHDQSYIHLAHLPLRDQKVYDLNHELNLKFLLDHHLSLNILLLILLFELLQGMSNPSSVMVASSVNKDLSFMF